MRRADPVAVEESTPASTASSSAPGSPISVSCDTRRSALSATASSNLRAGSASCATRVPSRSSTVSGTGMSSPSAGGPRSASVRPTSSANSGLPERGVEQPAQQLPRETQPEPLRQDSPRRSEAERADVERFTPRARARARARTDAGRLASKNPTCSPSSRRAAKASASADGGSSHWMSSTATRSGSAAASARSAFRNPTAIACGSGGGPVGSTRRAPPRARAAAERERRELLRLDPVEEVDQRGEREPRLGAARPRRQHPQPALPRGLDPRLPERRLPDPGPARENHRPPVRGARRKACSVASSASRPTMPCMCAG